MTPHERMLVRLVEGLIGVTLIAGTTAALQELSQAGLDGKIIWSVVLSTALLAAWQAGLAYLRANGELPLSTPAAPTSFAPVPRAAPLQPRQPGDGETHGGPSTPPSWLNDSQPLPRASFPPGSPRSAPTGPMPIPPRN